MSDENSKGNAEKSNDLFRQMSWKLWFFSFAVGKTRLASFKLSAAVLEWNPLAKISSLKISTPLLLVESQVEKFYSSIIGAVILFVDLLAHFQTVLPRTVLRKWAYFCRNIKKTFMEISPGKPRLTWSCCFVLRWKRSRFSLFHPRSATTENAY